MSIHAIGLVGLVGIFVLTAVRPIHLGVLAFGMTFVVSLGAPRQALAGFPTDLFILLVGVTYLFGVATQNGTVERVVTAAAQLARGRTSIVPWIIFGVAAMPAMAGALGSAGVALIAPLAMRLAERCAIDRRAMGLMVIHGAAAGNFSPLNVLAAITTQAVTDRGLSMSGTTLFWGNLAANILLGIVITVMFGRSSPSTTRGAAGAEAEQPGLKAQHLLTLGAIGAVAAAALVWGVNIGFAAIIAGIVLQSVFGTSTEGAERHVAWPVVLLVCGVVTYVAALQRLGTIDMVGTTLAHTGGPLTAALLICLVGGVTSAFASSAGILGALVPLAVPLLATGAVSTTGMVTALALSATLVDATPFSTVGALVVAHAAEDERTHIYRGLIAWGASMVVVAPLLAWLVFVVLG